METVEELEILHAALAVHLRRLTEGRLAARAVVVALEQAIIERERLLADEAGIEWPTGEVGGL